MKERRNAVACGVVSSVRAGSSMTKRMEAGSEQRLV